MRKSLIILLISLLVVACMPERGQSDSRSSNLISSVTRTPSIERIDSESVTFSVDNITIGLIRPQDWELYATDYGIVLTEFIGSIAVDGNLGDLLTQSLYRHWMMSP